MLWEQLSGRKEAFALDGSRCSGLFRRQMSEEAKDIAPDAAEEIKPARKKAAKKAAKRATKTAKSETPAAAEVPSAPAPEPVKAPAPAPSQDDFFSSDIEPIPYIAETAGGETPASPHKKKRRRKKKKNHQNQEHGGHQDHGHSHGQHPQHERPQAQAPVQQAAEPQPQEAHAHHTPTIHAAPKPKLDADQLARKAWKIFLSEVSEEGLALIDDQDAREISRRSFRLAEIFLEEAARRHR
jgi:hypothetical protein